MTDSLGFLNRPPSEAPSELTLDRYAAGELTPDERQRVERWLDAAPANRERLEARKAFPPTVDRDTSERLFARIEHNIDQLNPPEPVAPAPSWLRRFWRGLVKPGSLAAFGVLALALVLLVARPWQQPSPIEDELRPKGGFGFLVHRKTAAGSEVFVSGSEAREGDELRFELDVPEPRFVLVLDQDPSGALAVAWPLDGTERAREVQPGAHALDGAIELDDAIGDEWLHAISCASPQTLADFGLAGPGRLTAPATCVTQAVQLRKVAR